MPSNMEWTQLSNYVSNISQYCCGDTNIYLAKALAGTTGWSSSSNICAVGNDQNENNSTGFCVLPAGYYYGYYFGSGGDATFWSATEDYNGAARYSNLSSTNADVYRGVYGKSVGCSVRCLRD